MSARNVFHARRSKYHEILSNFLETEKKFQTIELNGESVRAVKKKLDAIISLRGWLNRITVLAVDDSINLVNTEKYSLLHLKRSSRRA